MGLFSKKKPQKPQDFNILSGDGLISYVAANLKNPTKANIVKAVQEIARPDKDQTHLTSDGELPWGWLSQNMPILKAKYEDPMVAIVGSLDELTVDEKIVQLKRLIALYAEFKEFCYSRDECFIKYFSDMWEHCHNSRCKDFEYITSFKEELKNIEENYAEMVQKEQRTNYIKAKILPTLRQDLIDAIKSEPGIFQVDLFKRYDVDLKPFIHTELYQLELDGMLVKEKEGRRNKLYLK